MKKVICTLAAAALLVVSSGAPATITTQTGPGTVLDCSKAQASLQVLWPPDHKMLIVHIVGITTPDDSTPTIAITSITQDEPVDMIGSGNTAPDGSGLGGAYAFVRAERSGTGTGRIYWIKFTASWTPKGSAVPETCMSPPVVQVFVPHDQGQHYNPVDTGLRVDSTTGQIL
jgi:hypothetical protein